MTALNPKTACSLLACLALSTTCALGVGCSEEEGLKVRRLSKDKGEVGDDVVVHGSGFQTGGTKSVRVYFGSQRAKVKKIMGDREILVEVPGGNDMGKTVDVELIFEPGGTAKLTKAFRYAQIAKLKVEDFDKDEAKKKGKKDP